ncbi:MAG: hypothetical protein AAGE76_14830 [Pseudomonadota bacterium]
MPVDLLYYVAGTFSLLMARAPTLIQMRICNIFASVLFVSYGAITGVWPVVVMNGLLGLVQLVRLARR